ncbi:MAG TPA: ABC transporter permease [bacterium]|nr:ABC transporter permease [bacterium]
MYRFLIRRILLMIPTLLGVAIVIFILMRMIPGDIVELRMAGEGGQVSQATIDQARHQLGLDRPLIAQFGTWIAGLAEFNLGKSMWTGRDVTYEISIRLPASLQIALMSTILATLLAIPLGTLAALRQDTWIDYVVRIFAIAGLATPSFWLGIMMLLSFLIFFHWTPPMSYSFPWEDPWANFSMMIWPALATGYRYSAVAMRMTRSSVLEVLREDYIRTARAKGLLEKIIINRHALTNAMLPVITVIGLEFAFLMGGLVVTEQVFNINGIGRLFVQAVGQKDYTMVQGLVLIVAFTFVFTNFVVDILYAWLDPRIKFS